MSLDFSSPMFGALPNHLPFFQYDEDGDAIMEDAPLTPPRIVRAASPPPAPARPVRPAGDGDEPVMRNLAEAMAEVVLHDEPAEDWCVSVRCSDLALSLDMRHPRVVLNLLRFVNTYNELAPEGEKIHLPPIPPSAADIILSHISVTHPVPEFASEVAELRALVDAYSSCRLCGWGGEGNDSESDSDSDSDSDSESDREYFRDYYRDYRN